MVGRRGRGIELGDVLPHHPRRHNLGSESGDSVPDHLDPALREPAMIKVIEPRHDLVLDDVVERLGLEIITPLGAIHALRRRVFPSRTPDRTTRPTIRRGWTDLPRR